MAKTKYVDPSVAIDVLKPIVFTIEKQFYGASQVDRCWLVIAESESPAKIIAVPKCLLPRIGGQRRRFLLIFYTITNNYSGSKKLNVSCRSPREG